MVKPDTHTRLHTFKKHERLSKKKFIDELFKSGTTFFDFPFKIFYLVHSHDDVSPVQVLFSVPKRLYKKAVKRNLIKRRIREAYRQNKHILNIPASKKAFIAYIYVSPEILGFQTIENKLITTLKRLNEEMNKNSGM